MLNLGVRRLIQTILTEVLDHLGLVLADCQHGDELEDAEPLDHFNDVHLLGKIFLELLVLFTLLHARIVCLLTSHTAAHEAYRVTKEELFATEIMLLTIINSFLSLADEVLSVDLRCHLSPIVTCRVEVDDKGVIVVPLLIPVEQRRENIPDDC